MTLLVKRDRRHDTVTMNRASQGEERAEGKSQVMGNGVMVEPPTETRNTEEKRGYL